MARITVEDCIKEVQNRFELVVVAAQRGKELNHGALPSIENNTKGKKDKDAIVALREIAAGKLNIQALRNSVVKRSVVEEHHNADKSKDIDAIEQEIIEEIESLKEISQSSNIQKEQLYQDEEITEE